MDVSPSSKLKSSSNKLKQDGSESNPQSPNSQEASKALIDLLYLPFEPITKA